MPTLEIVRVGVSPAAKIWQNELQTCVQTLPGVAIALIERSSYLDIPDPASVDFFLQLGGTIPDSTFATQVGTETMIWISNPTNSIQQLTNQQLSDLYQGIQVNSPGISGEFSASFEVWIYPPGDFLTEFLFSQFGISKTILSKANVAPDPEAMLQAVSENTNALGYVPESWLNAEPIGKEVHQISLIDPAQPEFQLRIPILAIAAREPESTGRQLLICLEDSLKNRP